ncbi:metallo-beta-lactamase [Cutibacterium acnes JCM 18918]|nr:metallo-beta-lactamase [Cutibacterium acnes JCM 18918]
MAMSTNPEIPQWFALTPRVWTTSVEPESVTCGLVAGEDHVLLIDTGSTPEQGHTLRCQQPVCWAAPSIESSSPITTTTTAVAYLASPMLKCGCTRLR